MTHPRDVGAFQHVFLHILLQLLQCSCCFAFFAVQLLQYNHCNATVSMQLLQWNCCSVKCSNTCSYVGTWMPVVYTPVTFVKGFLAEIYCYIFREFQLHWLFDCRVSCPELHYFFSVILSNCFGAVLVKISAAGSLLVHCAVKSSCRSKKVFQILLVCRAKSRRLKYSNGVPRTMLCGHQSCSRVPFHWVAFKWCPITCQTSKIQPTIVPVESNR